MTKARLSTLGLIFITFLSAIQYIFLQNVPDTVSTFSFLCVTNLIGFVILGLSQIKKLLSLKKKTLLKGILFAVELSGFNFFLLLGSRHLDSVIISSVVSMYFVFVTPMLLLFRKKVNFFASIATVIAIIALLLMFGADTDALFSSKDVVYLLIADIFFASYLVSVSILGADEDSTQLTLSQMLFAVIFALVGWFVESRLGQTEFVLPTDTNFWISALFIGIFIRAIYGLIQIVSQKYVPAINASLIFSSEIIITLILSPILCRLFGTVYTPATVYQIIGCVLFIIATLLVDETFTDRLGFSGLEPPATVDENGVVVQKSSVSKKMIVTTLAFALITLILSTIMCLSAIYLIRDSAVDSSTALGEDASNISATSLTDELENKMQQLTQDKAKLAEAKLDTYAVSSMFAASYAKSLYRDAAEYPAKEVMRPLQYNAGKWVMQRVLANEDITYESVRDENRLLGNMIDVFAPIIKNNKNIATIYLGTESGLLISYDPNSGDGNPDGESYYEFRDTSWYQLAKQTSDYVFTDTYQDGYGRGLTITCVAPFTDFKGHFMGCVAMDILMNDLNESMVSDGIFDPNVATLIDNEGYIIANKDVDPLSEEKVNIFTSDIDPRLTVVGSEILQKKDGITSTGSGNDATYIAYSTIDSTDWTLCILSPVYAVIEPANIIRNNINENTKNVVNSVVEGIKLVVQDCLILSAIILIVSTLFVGKFSRRISDPLKKLESDVQLISEGNFDRRTDVNTNDEIGNLASSFNFMTDSIQKYIVDLKEITTKEERIATELSTATKIQADMLPSVFPAFPGRKDFDIYATMTPSKEVGGDFYDFFMIDDSHIALVMADVSGKGVPAALFMVIAKSLIKNRAQMGGTPSEILHDVNEQLCENNKEEMFVTVWLAIVDLTTGEGVEANAGHEYPAIRRKNGEFELIRTRHSLALATMEGLRFKQNEFHLDPGDRLFVYTDGVPEATNAQNVLFGDERMLESLNSHKNLPLGELLAGVKADVDRFVGEAPQFDDMTMLGFDFNGSEE